MDIHGGKIQWVFNWEPRQLKAVLIVELESSKQSFSSKLPDSAWSSPLSWLTAAQPALLRSYFRVWATIHASLAKGEQQADIYCKLHGKNKDVKILE